MIIISLRLHNWWQRQWQKCDRWRMKTTHTLQHERYNPFVSYLAFHGMTIDQSRFHLAIEISSSFVWRLKAQRDRKCHNGNILGILSHRTIDISKVDVYFIIKSENWLFKLSQQISEHMPLRCLPRIYQIFKMISVQMVEVTQQPNGKAVFRAFVTEQTIK